MYFAKTSRHGLERPRSRRRKGHGKRRDFIVSLEKAAVLPEHFSDVGMSIYTNFACGPAL